VVTNEFDLVRREVDPLTRARRATELVALYQQRSIELARLRRTAIEEAVRERGITYTAAAQAAGISKGRVSQLRKSAPPAARILFGVGPVLVAVPTRAMPDRTLPVISAEDSIAAEHMSDLLRAYGFTVNQFRIPTDGQWRPTGDVVAICGPKSSSVTADALTADPSLDFTANGTDRWAITDRITGNVWDSPMDDDPAENADVAYIGRIRSDGANVFLIAGVHAIGSVGAIHHLATPGVAEALYATVGEAPFSAVIRSTFDGESITSTDYAVSPRVHP
jgi:hypothetical protein